MKIHRLPRQNRRREQGQALLWIAILLPLFIALVGLVLDGGYLWQQYVRARWAVSSAAVAAASEIDPQTFTGSGRMILKPEARAVASDYATRNDPQLHVTDVHIQDNRYIVVQGWSEAQTVFLSIFGVNGFRLNVRAIERPAWGVGQEGQ